ncbi:MAG: AraC family transcriptional regulator [Cyanobacteria bacterium P01_G01_bin.38]
MAIELTEQEYIELVEQAQQVYQITEFCTQYETPQLLGEGCTRDIQLREGLEISILSGQLQQPLRYQIQHSDPFPIVGKFYLSGSSKVRTDDVPETFAEYEEIAGCNYLYCLPDLTETEEWQPDEFTQVVSVAADLAYFQALTSTDEGLPPCLQRLLQTTGRFHQPLGKMTLMMNQVLRQILCCPYEGVTQRLYLECKAIELLTLQFACLDTNLPRQSSLKSGELEKVQIAREILVQRLNSPPALIELAHQVGLSNRKLQQGFQHLFGTTVFGYLCNYRMEQAKHLLDQSYTTVAEVAVKVGYRNPEAFSTAFRRKFAMSPKAYQLGQRR